MTDVLAIDTSAGTSVARIDGEHITRASDPNPRAHAENLAPLITQVGGASGVDLIVVGTGPAPFTGLRVGIATARVLADALGVELAGVSVLDALARQALDTSQADEVTVVTDARRREVYTASFTAHGADDVEVIRPAQVLSPADLDVVGELVGATHLVPEATGRPLELDVAVLARIALQRRAAGVEMPTTALYLREPDIHNAPRPDRV